MPTAKAHDATGDTNFVDLHLYSRMYQFPEYVKRAAPAATLQPEGLPATAYADPRKRQFPCHTKAATWVSALFFLEKQADIHPKTAEWINRGLLQFAQHHGIREDLTKLASEHKQLHKEASDQIPDSEFAIVWVDEGGHKDRRYPLDTSVRTKAAAEWFAEFRDHFIFQDRQRIAEKILEKAAQHGVGLDPELDHLLEKQAGHGVYDPAEAVEMIRNRAMINRASGPVRDRLLKLAEAIDTNPRLAEDPTTTAHLAATIDQFDRNFGLVGKYSSSFPRPEDILFKGSLKLASEFTKKACALLTGSIYSQDQFSKLSVDQVRSSLGDDIAAAVTTGLHVDPVKMADVAPTLPLDDAQMLDRLMTAVGQGPLRSKAGSIGASKEDREKLAKEYRFASGLPEVDEVGTPTGVSGSRVIGGVA